LRADTSVQVQCVVAEGDLPVQISWTFHGSDSSLHTAPGVTTMKIGQKSNLLLIDSISFEHAGMHTVSNSYVGFMGC